MFVATGVTSAASERYYKVSAEALRVCERLVPVLRGEGGAPVDPAMVPVAQVGDCGIVCLQTATSWLPHLLVVSCRCCAEGLQVGLLLCHVGHRACGPCHGHCGLRWVILFRGCTVA